MGYGDVQNPAAFDKQTSLPFNEQYDSAKNYAGIIDSYDPRLYQASEKIVNVVQSMAPQAAQAIAYHGSIYTGVPQDFATNRLYIANTRKRENSVYAFV